MHTAVSGTRRRTRRATRAAPGTRGEPWKEAGLSRSAWYRRGLHRAPVPKPAAPPPTNRLADFAAQLETTQGQGEGSAFRVLDWERRFFERIDATRGGELAMTIAAGAGKTTVASIVGLAALLGPLARRRGTVAIVAGSFGQARLTYEHVISFAAPWSKAAPKGQFRVQDSAQLASIENRANGAKLQAREASARTLHGLAASLIICDEPSQWQETQRDKIYSALRSRLGKIPGS